MTEATTLDERMGRVSRDVADRWTREAAFTSVAELAWTADLVKLRMREAMKGVGAITGRAGPSQKTGFWPETTFDKGFLNSLTEQERQKWYRDKNAGNKGAAFVEVGRVEQAIYWPARYLIADDHEEERMALRCWAWCQATRNRFSQHFRILGCPKRTADRRLERGFEIILAGLLRDGVMP